MRRSSVINFKLYWQFYWCLDIILCKKTDSWQNYRIIIQRKHISHLFFADQVDFVLLPLNKHHDNESLSVILQCKYACFIFTLTQVTCVRHIANKARRISMHQHAPLIITISGDYQNKSENSLLALYYTEI